MKEKETVILDSKRAFNISEVRRSFLTLGFPRSVWEALTNRKTRGSLKILDKPAMCCAQPVNAINGVKNRSRRISILKHTLSINCDLKGISISRKETGMIGWSPMFPSRKTSQVGMSSTIHFWYKNCALHQGSSGLEMLGGQLRRRIPTTFLTGTHLQRDKN